MARNGHPTAQEQFYQNQMIQQSQASQHNQLHGQHYSSQHRDYPPQNVGQDRAGDAPYYGNRQHVPYQEVSRQSATERQYTPNNQSYETYDRSRAQHQQDPRMYHYDERFRTHNNNAGAAVSNGYTTREARQSPTQARPGTSSSNRHPKRDRILNDSPGSPKAAAWDSPFGVFPGSKKDLQNKAREDEERNRAKTPSSRPTSSSSRPRTRDSRERAATPSSTRRPHHSSGAAQFPARGAEQRPFIVQTTSQPEMPLQKRSANTQEAANYNYSRVSLDGGRNNPVHYHTQQARPTPQRSLTGPPPDTTLPPPPRPTPQHPSQTELAHDPRQPQVLHKLTKNRVSEDVHRATGIPEPQSGPVEESHEANIPHEPLVLTRSNQTTHSFGAHDANAYRGVPVTNRRPSGTGDNAMPNFAAMSLSTDNIERELTMTAPTIYKKPMYGQSTPCLPSTETSLPPAAPPLSSYDQTRPSLDGFSFDLPRAESAAYRTDLHNQARDRANPDYETRIDRHQINHERNVRREPNHDFRPPQERSQFPSRFDSQGHPPWNTQVNTNQYEERYRDNHQSPIQSYQPAPRERHHSQPNEYGQYDPNRAFQQDVYHDRRPGHATYESSQPIVNGPRYQQDLYGQRPQMFPQYESAPQQLNDHHDGRSPQTHDQIRGHDTQSSRPAPERPLGYDDLYRKPAPPSGLPPRPRTANSIHPPRRHHPDMLPQHPLPTSTMPLADRGHPAPIRPGLSGPLTQESTRRAETENRANAHPPAQIVESSQPPASSTPSPVTKTELNQLQNQFRNSPNDFKLGLHFAKRLVEAAKTLPTQDTNDPKAIAKGRERYINDAHRTVKKLVAAGSADAMFYLADSYGNGQLGLAADASEAFKLYTSAAKLGHAQAAYRVAVCCELGQDGGGGTRRDHARAVQFYKRAATMGDGPAMYKIGMISLKGLLGVPANAREGITWLKRAAERADKDNPHALHELGMLYESAKSTDVVLRDETYALSLYQQAAALGYKHSQWRLGSAYEYGTLTCPIDPHQSITWYSRAAKQNEHQSEFALSGWYLTGAPPLLDQSDQEAYLWARKAASSGLVKAEYAMGYYTETGIGVKSDLEEARKWYFRAAAQGDLRARNRLEEIKRGGKKRERAKVSRKDVGRQNEGECVVM